MFRITQDPSSGSLVQCWAKITRMILSCLLAWTRSVLWQHVVTGCVCVWFVCGVYVCVCVCGLCVVCMCGVCVCGVCGGVCLVHCI